MASGGRTFSPEEIQESLMILRMNISLLHGRDPTSVLSVSCQSMHFHHPNAHSNWGAPNYQTQTVNINSVLK